MLKKVLLLLVLCLALFGCEIEPTPEYELTFETGNLGSNYVDNVTTGISGAKSGTFYCVNNIMVNNYSSVSYDYKQIGREYIDISWEIVKREYEYEYFIYNNKSNIVKTIGKYSKKVYIDSDATIYLGINTLIKEKQE